MNLYEIEDIVNSNQKSIVSENRKNKINELIAGKNIEVLWHLAFRSGKDSRIPVKCLIDNEYSIYYSSHLCRGIISCSYCLNTTHVKLLKSKGFNFVSKSTIDGKSVIVGECCNCNNVVKSTISNLHSEYNITCQNCEHMKIVNSLKLKQCEYISERLEKYIKRITYRNKDGEVFENSQSNIVRGCFTNGGSHWGQEHSLYLIKCTFNSKSYYKIGTANNVESRLSSLKLLGSSSVKTLQVFDSRYEANKQEKYLHSLFKEFNLDTSVAESFTCGLSKLKKKAGITEWFSEDLLPQLNKIYKDK